MLSFFSYLSILHYSLFFFFFNDTATTEIYTLSLHDALPISVRKVAPGVAGVGAAVAGVDDHGVAEAEAADRVGCRGGGRGGRGGGRGAPPPPPPRPPTRRRPPPARTPGPHPPPPLDPRRPLD